MHTALHIYKPAGMNNKFCSDRLTAGLQFCWEVNPLLYVSFDVGSSKGINSWLVSLQRTCSVTECTVVLDSLKNVIPFQMSYVMQPIILFMRPGLCIPRKIIYHINPI